MRVALAFIICVLHGHVANAGGVAWESVRMEPIASTSLDLGGKLCVAHYAEDNKQGFGIPALRSRYKVSESVPFALLSTSSNSCTDAQTRAWNSTALLFGQGTITERLPDPFISDDALRARLCAPANQQVTLAGVVDYLQTLGENEPTSSLASLFVNTRPALNESNPPQGFWTTKLRSDVIQHFLFYRADQCDVKLERLGTAFDYEDEKCGVHADGLFECPTAEPPERLIVRLESLEEGNAKVEYCSGLLLNSSTILTARHCLRQCAPDPVRMDWSSLSVDFGYSGESIDRPLSVPVRSVLFAGASTAAGEDFAVLRVWPDPRIAELLAETGVVRRRGYTDRMVDSSMLIGHPGGGPLRRSCGGCEVFYRDETQGIGYHTCKAVPATSGAPVWTHGLPEGLHVAAASRECRADGEGNLSWYEDIPDLVRKELEVNSLGRRRCIGRIERLSSMRNKLCREKFTNDPHKREACEGFVIVGAP